MSVDQPRPWPLIVRRARPADHDAVMSFASTTWDGWDYIPRAWPYWLSAPDGVVLIGTAGRPADGGSALDAEGVPIPLDQPIAVARVARLSATETWLEGIRVDPRLRGFGVATDLQVAELRWAAASGAAVIRYATGERNEASHRLGARHGFSLLARFRLWQWHERPPTDEEEAEEGPSGFDQAARQRANGVRRTTLAALAADGFACPAGDTASWWQRVDEDPLFNAGQRLSEHRGWTMQELRRAALEAHVANGEVLVAGNPAGEGSWAVAILHREALPAEDADIKLGLLVGRAAALVGLADAVRRRAGESVSFWLPDTEPSRDHVQRDDAQRNALVEAGFHPRPWALHILARPLHSQPLPEPSDPAGLVLSDPPIPLDAPAYAQRRIAPTRRPRG